MLVYSYISSIPDIDGVHLVPSVTIWRTLAESVAGSYKSRL